VGVSLRNQPRDAGLGVAPKPVEITGLAAPARLAGRPSLAVLPFENLSGDPSQDFFSDGITEDIITALGRFSNLLVVAKSASFPLKGQKLAPAEIGQRLDVRYLLDGSVRRAGDRVRVNAELTEAMTGRNIWSQVYDAEVKDIFGVQEDIARRVVGAAAVKLTRFEWERALDKPTSSLAAYEYVLPGREVFSHATTRWSAQPRSSSPIRPRQIDTLITVCGPVRSSPRAVLAHGDRCVRSGGALVQTGRQGDAGGLQDATDLAGDGGAGGDALPSFSIVASWRSRSRSRSPLSHDQAARSGPEEGGSSVLFSRIVPRSV